MRFIVRKACVALANPILKELPFFIMFFFLFGLPILGEILYLFHEYSPMTARGLIGRLGLLFLYGYPLTLLIHYSRSKIIKIFVYAIVLFFFGVNTFLAQNYGYTINMNVLMLVLETNSREASEFMNSYLFTEASVTTYGKVVIRLVMILVLEYVYNRFVIKSHHPHRRLEIWLAIAIVLLFGWGVISFGAIIRICSHNTTEHFFHQQQIEDIRPTDPISCIILSVYGLRTVSHEMKYAIETTLNLKEIQPVDPSDSLDVILIIGESANKWHFGVYGYEHQTTPFLSQEVQKGNLFVFNDVVCPFCLTSPSVKSMLSCNSISDGEAWSKHPFVPAIFKAAHYNVYSWDNQKTFEPGMSYSISLQSYLFDKQLSRVSYTAVNDSSFRYDDELISSFEKTVQDVSDHNLILFHLMGQHFLAGERYPHTDEFTRFTVDSVHRNEDYMQYQLKKQRIADYDNAVLYNDAVINHVLNLYRNRNAIVIFLSDHGEETYDYKDAIFRYYEGYMTKGWIKHVHNIPFMVWCSDRYIHGHEETVNAVRKAVDRPFMIDNLCHLLFHLGEIRSDYYIPERDLISDQFIPRKRLIEDMFFKKFDYDEIKNNP